MAIKISIQVDSASSYTRWRDMYDVNVYTTEWSRFDGVGCNQREGEFTFDQNLGRFASRGGAWRRVMRRLANFYAFGEVRTQTQCTIFLDWLREHHYEVASDCEALLRSDTSHVVALGRPAQGGW